MSDDPRKLGGDISGPGGPHDQGGVVIDAQNAVLFDDLKVAMVDPVRDGKSAASPAVAVLLSGRINKTRERASVLYLMDEEGTSLIISELLALYGRMGPQYLERLMERLATLEQEGNLGPRQ